MSETKLFNIGQVCENLIEEFPQITVSKIRYLESQGLLTPTRTESGYRKFSTSDLDKLVWILRQQRDYFVPLKTIKERLDKKGFDFETDEMPEKSDSDRKFEEDPITTGISLDIKGLAKASGVPLEKIEELNELGVIKGRKVGNKQIFEGEALITVRSAKRLFELGMEVRHLRMYLVAAQREAGVIEQLLSAKSKSEDLKSRVEAKRELNEVVALGREIHKCLLKLSLDGLETW
ncbi:MAG: MerR family transcriptional regulator [Actinomycetota bacterium]|nr:MerR family transcriptional regulator [Acidimicrobiales bacterium]MEC7899200.1 MerR family transcriptional regulator [Actinomycetota bacterium]